MNRQESIAEAKRIVIKLGTSTVSSSDGGISRDRLRVILSAMAAHHRKGADILLVSSGAVGLGKKALGLSGPLPALQERQACAAIGQSRLMGFYDQELTALGCRAAQLLLTQADFDHRVRYLNLRSTLMALLRHRVIPVINENDSVSTEELAFLEGMASPIFGDNDLLSALVATKLEADLLILLTDVEGVYDQDPRDHPQANLLERVDDLVAIVGGEASPGGRGGMRSKLDAAAIAVRGGCDAIIASGQAPELLSRLLAGDPIGTWFPKRDRLNAKRQWIAAGTAPRGVLYLDQGAVQALKDSGASLLAAGVSKIEGDFQPGDVVELRDLRGATLGRGIVSSDTESARQWCAGAAPFGVRNRDALVHRDHLWLE